MDKSWWKKFRRKAEKLMRRVKKQETPDFDESHQQYKLVSLYLSSYGGKKKKGVRAPPVSGTALYYVIGETDDGVKLLHPVLLETYTTSKRQFDKGMTDVWWPNEAAISNPNAKNRSGYFCNRFNVANTMLTKLESYAKRGKVNEKKQKVIRLAIADLKSVSVNEIPKFKLPEKVNHLQLWKEAMANVLYKKRARADLQKYKLKENEIMSKKDKSSSSAASSSSASDSDAKTKKGKKKGSSSDSDTKVKKTKKSKKDKTKKSSKSEKKSKGSKEAKAPRGKKTAMAVALRYLLKKKGKKISIENLCKEIQKAKGRKKEFPEKMILGKVKKMQKWAERNGMTLKASSSSMTLS